jgi:4-cresol dehydrogenase (hydroxylating)
MTPPPPGVTPGAFSQALQSFARVVGPDWVFTSEEDLETYRDAYSPVRGEADERRASAAVAPSTTEEVQEIVRIANRLRVPLYPISTGKNLGYGGAAPACSGCVVLDLKRMNRILEVDERNACVLVEPGVSYFDLYRHLQARGSRLMMDVPDPGWGSLIGNALDRGAGYTVTHLRDHFDSHCGMEIVLPDGQLMRTGMGAMPGAGTWQQYKSGFGPLVDGIFSQSNFGIVTKMGFWLMPEPEAYLKGRVSVFGYRDLVPLIDIMTHLENTRVFNGLPDLHSPLLVAPALLDLHDFGEVGPPAMKPEHMALLARHAPPAELEAYARHARVPYWGCDFAFYGPEEVIRAQWAHVKKRYTGSIPDVTFQDRVFCRFPATPEERVRHGTEFGVPNLRGFSVGIRTKWNPEGSHGHMWFSPVIPRTGEAVFEAQQVFADFSRRENVRLLNGALPLTCWQRNFLYIIGFFVSNDPATNRNYVEKFRKLVRVAAEHGWGEYRTSPIFQDEVMDTYSFNDHALLRFHERLKDAIDPNGIISPGRYGIWPRHLRGARR